MSHSERCRLGCVSLLGDFEYCCATSLTVAGMRPAIILLQIFAAILCLQVARSGKILLVSTHSTRMSVHATVSDAFKRARSA